MLTLMALDPGAARMGYAILRYDGTKSLEYLYSGILDVAKKNMKYAEYRREIVKQFTIAADDLIHFHGVDEVVSEIIPTTGYSNSAQAWLALSAMTAVQGQAYYNRCSVSEIAAVTVKLRIGEDRKATKVKVRDGVLKILPELEIKRSRWTKVFDESDAIAIGLTHIGYDNRG